MFAARLLKSTIRSGHLARAQCAIYTLALQSFVITSTLLRRYYIKPILHISHVAFSSSYDPCIEDTPHQAVVDQRVSLILFVYLSLPKV